MKKEPIINLEPFLQKDSESIPLTRVFNIENFVKEPISLGQITSEMQEFFTNDKCGREWLSNLTGKKVSITGKYEKFGNNKYFNKMLVKDCTIQIDNKNLYIGHMWWQNVQNSKDLKKQLIRGQLIRGEGVVGIYNCKDKTYPYDDTYGLADVEIFKI